MPLDAGSQDFIRVFFPPVFGGKDFDFALAFESGDFDPVSDFANINDAIAHHAAVEQHICCRNQPVADVKGQDLVVSSSARYLVLKVRVPPDVLYINGDTDAGNQPVTYIKRMF